MLAHIFISYYCNVNELLMYGGLHGRAKVEKYYIKIKPETMQKMQLRFSGRSQTHASA